MKAWFLATGLFATCAFMNSGCVSTSVTDLVDRHPGESPKGYAEFYAADGNSLGLWLAVYEKQGAKYFTDGSFGGRSRLRVACAPGKTAFFVEASALTTGIGSGNRYRIKKDDFSSDATASRVTGLQALLFNIRPVTVQVQEAMVTPVRVILNENSRERDGSMVTTKFSFTVEAETPQAATNLAFATAQSKTAGRKVEPVAIPSDAGSSACVKSVTADPAAKPDDHIYIVMTPIAALSIDCVKEGVTRGDFENKVRAILRENGISSVVIEYADGARNTVALGQAKAESMPAAIHPEVSPGDVKKITDQVKLAELAIGGKDKGVRKAAVEALTDQALISKVILEAKHADIRGDAARKSQDRHLLAKIAVEDEDQWVRSAAVNNRISDQSVLERAALEDGSHWVRRTAVPRLTNQVVLVKVALEDQDSGVRLDAVARVDDQNILARVAIGDKSLTVCRVAVERLKDRELLRKVAEKAATEHTRRKAAEKAESVQ
jgi:hypothetical protein